MTISTQAATTSFLKDSNTFLKLLSTQVKNQDPLSPMDATQFTQQLATFAEVEQSIAQSGKLDQMIGLMQGRGVADGASLIGREASASAASFDTDGAGALHWTLPAGAAGTTAEISDASGKLLLSRPVGSGDTALDWSAPAAGHYAIRLRALDGSTASAAPLLAGPVGAVEQDGGQLYARIGVARVPVSAIAALRPAG